LSACISDVCSSGSSPLAPLLSVSALAVYFLVLLFFFSAYRLRSLSVSPNPRQALHATADRAGVETRSSPATHRGTNCQKNSHQTLTTDHYDRRMRGVNKVILIGNATRAAEFRHTQNGKPVTSIRLATNRQIKGEEETQFHSIVCWDRLAEITAEYVKKGDPL